jgi:hypothetical protein
VLREDPSLDNLLKAAWAMELADHQATAMEGEPPGSKGWLTRSCC